VAKTEREKSGVLLLATRNAKSRARGRIAKVISKGTFLTWARKTSAGQYRDQ